MWSYLLQLQKKKKWTGFVFIHHRGWLSDILIQVKFLANVSIVWTWLLTSHRAQQWQHAVADGHFYLGYCAWHHFEADSHSLPANPEIQEQLCHYITQPGITQTNKLSPIFFLFFSVAKAMSYWSEVVKWLISALQRKADGLEVWLPEFPRLSPLSPIPHFFLAVFHFNTEFLGLNVAHGNCSLSFYGLSSKSCLSMVWPRCHGPIPEIGLLCHSWVPASTLCLSLYLISKLWSTFLSFLSRNYKGNILLILVCLLPVSRILTWALTQRVGPRHLVGWFFGCWIQGYYQDPLRFPYSCVSPTMNFPQETSCKLPAVHSSSRLGVILLHLMLVAFLVRP